MIDYKNGFDIPEGLRGIVQLMSEDCSGNMEDPFISNYCLDIEGHEQDQKSRLYLRLNHGLRNRLVVANVAFIHQRQGNMTKLFEILKKIYQEEHLDSIVIENVLSGEMKNWCIKNGFQKQLIKEEVSDWYWPECETSEFSLDDLFGKDAQ